MTAALQALQRLREGNRRFVEDMRRGQKHDVCLRAVGMAADQHPFAIVIGCADSRVPVEFVFDQGFGELFVVRVAGNIVGRSQIGSVELAAEKFETRLVVVMGHSRCGSVAAALDRIRHPDDETCSPELCSLLDDVRPSVEAAMAAGHGDDAAMQRDAIRRNVHAAVERLCTGSALLQRLIRDEGLLVVGAEYDLDSGEVEFFEGVPVTV